MYKILGLLLSTAEIKKKRLYLCSRFGVMLILKLINQVYYYMIVILVLSKQRQENHSKFEAHLVYSDVHASQGLHSKTLSQK